jgi:hypothetical protein
MAVLVTVALLMPGASFLFNINPVPSFDVVRTACVDLNVYPWRCRQVAIDVDIHVGRTRQPRRCGKARRSRQPRRCGKPGLGVFETEGDGNCCHYQHGKNRLCTHYGSFFNW